MKPNADCVRSRQKARARSSTCCSSCRRAISIEIEYSDSSCWRNAVAGESCIFPCHASRGVNVLNVVLPLGSAVLSFVFAAMVFDQWLQRHHSFQLVWAVGLVWYGVAAGCEFAGGAFGWNEALYRTWYLIGAFFVAAYRGAGTVSLLRKGRFGYFAGVTVLIGGTLSLVFSHVNARGTHTALYPGSGTAGTVA